MQIDHFKKEIKKRRTATIPKTRDLVEEAFQDSSFYKEDASYFLENAIDILYNTRTKCWTTYLEHEKEFNRVMSAILIEKDAEIKDCENQNSKEIIGSFLDKYSEHLFELSKSNTNSRRSRAGKEFEAIIEIILLRTGIYFDDQGIIGSKLFSTERLGKLVDCVIPGVTEYNLEKRRCALVSMKTSLRERWQEVPEEMIRTGAQEMFLVTLDNKITKNTIESLASHNITLVVPDDLKLNIYNEYLSVYGLTKFLFEMISLNQYWISRKDLSKSYYQDKLDTVSLRLEGINDKYESLIFEQIKKFCLDKLTIL